MGAPSAATAGSGKLMQACIDQALAEAPGLVMRWCNALQASLRQQEAWTQAPAAKAQLASALKELTLSKDAWMQRWPGQWRDTILDTMRRRGDLDLPRKSLATVSFDELELMDEFQIQSTVQAARVEQAAQGAAGSVLSDLTALLSSVQGFTSVRPENNPLRPEVALTALKLTMETLTRDAVVRNLWLQHGSDALGQELQVLYRQLVRWLTQQGVKPADYHLVQSASPVGPAARQGAARHRPVGLGDLEDVITPQAVPVAADDPTPSAFLTLDYLHDLIVTGPGELHERPLDKATGGTPLPSVPGLPELPRVVPVPRAPAPQAAQGTEAVPDGGDHLRALASEVVNLMLEGMARDARMLPGVMRCLRQMRPALLRIAAEDPRFFVDRDNPARRLLDDITQRNLAVGAEGAPGFAALQSALEDVVLLLERTDVRVNSLFETAIDVLTELDLSEQSPVPASQNEASRAVQSLALAEQRQLLAQRIALELSQRPDFAKGAALVQHFLRGPWPLVVAHARLQGVDAVGTTAARFPADVRYMGAVSDLIWSSRAEATKLNRGRLARLIPGLLRTLREGLSSIGFEGKASRQFFAQLMVLHEAGLKGETASDAALAPVPSWPTEVADPSDGVWVRPTEAADTGLLDEPLPVLTHEVDFEDTLPLVRPRSEAAAPLEVGTWIELHRASGDWVRLRLAWISPHGLMYLFSGATGRTSSMSKRHFESMREAGRIRLLATQSLVDDALDSVMSQALQNSARRAEPHSGFHSDYPDLLPPLA